MLSRERWTHGLGGDQWRCAVEAIAAQIPGACYLETASGHSMPHQTPELFLEAVLPFLQES